MENNDTWKTLASIGLGGTLVGLALSNPETYQKVFGQTVEEIRTIQKEVEEIKEIKAKAKAQRMNPLPPLKSRRMQEIGRLTGVALNEIIENDIANIEKFNASAGSKKWAIRMTEANHFQKKVDGKMVDLADAEIAAREVALRRTARVMLNTPALNMNLDYIEKRMESLNKKSGKELLDTLAKMYDEMESDFLPDHQKRAFRKTYQNEWNKQKSLASRMAEKGQDMFDVERGFADWVSDKDKHRPRYNQIAISRAKDGEPGFDYIENRIKEYMAQENLPFDDAFTQKITMARRNYNAIREAYSKHLNNRPAVYTINLVEDQIRGGNALMMKVSYKNIIGSDGATFDLPLWVNRDAHFGVGLNETLSRSKGGITYEAPGSGARGYQSAIALPGELPSLKGEVLSAEEMMIRQFERSLEQISTTPNISRIGLQRAREKFSQTTFDRGQRLLPNVKGTQAANAVLATFQAVVTDNEFVLGDPAQIETIAQNRNLKILDLAPSAVRNDMRVYQAAAPTIETQLLGVSPDTLDIMPTDKTASFRKSITLTSKHTPIGEIEGGILPPQKSLNYEGALYTPEELRKHLRQKEKDYLKANLVTRENTLYSDEILAPLSKKEKALQLEKFKKINKEERAKLRQQFATSNKQVFEDIKAAEKIYEDARKAREESKIRTNDFIGYNTDDAVVKAQSSNRRFNAIVYQDGILDANFRTRYQMGEGLYIGKTHGFVSDASPIKNLKDLTPGWAKVWQEGQSQIVGGKNTWNVFVSKDRFKEIGNIVGLNDAGNVIDINIRGTNFEGLEVSVNPTTGGMIYRTVYGKGDFSKVKGFGVKGQIVQSDNDTILRETAYALGEVEVDGKVSNINAARILGKGSNTIISDLDQVMRTPFAIKEAVAGGAAILLSNTGKEWRSKIKAAYDEAGVRINNDPLTVGEKDPKIFFNAIFKELRTGGVTASDAGFNIRGAFSYLTEQKMPKEEEAFVQKWKELLSSGDKAYDEAAARAAFKQRGFLGGGTLSYDTPSELGGAGKIASIERRGMHSILLNLEHAGLNDVESAKIMADIMSRVDKGSPGNWRRTYETTNLSYFSIQDPTYIETGKLFENMKNREKLRVVEMDLTVPEGLSILDRVDETEFKNAHLVKINLGETHASAVLKKRLGINSFYIPGGAGIPEIERLTVQREKATVSLSDEFIEARNNMLKTLADPNASEDHIAEELYNYRNAAALAAAETLRNNMSGKVAGAAQGRFLTLYDQQFKGKDNVVRSSKYFGKMKKLAEGDKWQSLFIRDAVFFQQMKGLKSNAEYMPQALRDDTKKLIKEHISNFLFNENGYNTAFFSRNPTLSEGHGAMTKQRRFIDSNVNDVILSNREMREAIDEVFKAHNYTDKVTSEKRRQLLLDIILDEDKSGLKMSKEARAATRAKLSEVVFENLDTLHRKSLAEQGANIYTVMGDRLDYKIKKDGQWVDETSKKIFYSRAYRSIGDHDGDVVSVMVLSNSESNKIATSRLKNAAYADKMIGADIEFDVMNKRIAMTQELYAKGMAQESLSMGERAVSFLKNIYYKNIGGYSIAIDKIKSALMSDETLDTTRRRQYVDLLLAMEENMLKAKKIKGKVVDFGAEFATAVNTGDKAAYRELLEKRIAKWSDVDEFQYGGKTVTFKYGEIFDQMWESLERYKRSGGTASRNLKDVTNTIARGAPGYEDAHRITRVLKSSNEGNMSFINAAANPPQAVIDTSAVQGSVSGAANGAAAAGADAARAADNASPSMSRAVKGYLGEGVDNFIGTAYKAIKGSTLTERTIAGGIATLAMYGLFSGNEHKEAEYITPSRFQINPSQVLQQETTLDPNLNTGRANVQINSLSELPGVNRTLAASGIRKQSLIIQDNRTPITKNFTDRRER